MLYKAKTESRLNQPLVMMLVLFYNMASALVLYWSVSQALSIVQLLMQRRKKQK